MNTLNEAELAVYAREITRLNNRIKADTERLEHLKDVLREHLEAGDTYAAGKHSITVAPNRAIDSAAFSAAYPLSPATAHLYKATPDLAAIRRHLAPVEVEGLMVESGKARVSDK